MSKPRLEVPKVNVALDNLKSVCAPPPPKTCGNCAHRRNRDNYERCFALPPQAALPWGEKAFRPVVAAADPACKEWEQA